VAKQQRHGIRHFGKRLFRGDHWRNQRLRRAHQLKPHLVKRFRVSEDPEFGRRLEDIVGLNLDPPESAIILCIDEKSQVQELEGAQPMLPLRRSSPPARVHHGLCPSLE
jgi:hypothetical protein